MSRMIWDHTKWYEINDETKSYYDHINEMIIWFWTYMKWKKSCTRWFKVTFHPLFLRSLNLWKGHLSIPKRSRSQNCQVWNDMNSFTPGSTPCFNRCCHAQGSAVLKKIRVWPLFNLPRRRQWYQASQVKATGQPRWVFVFSSPLVGWVLFGGDEINYPIISRDYFTSRAIQIPEPEPIRMTHGSYHVRVLFALNVAQVKFIHKTQRVE